MLRFFSSSLIPLATAWALHAQSRPAVGKSKRYCNPLPLKASSRDGSPQGVSLDDVTVVREGDLYYRFGTGGGAWVSRDFIDWKYQPVEVKGGRLPVAPHVAKHNGVPEQGDWYARNMYIQGSAQNKFHVATHGHPSKFGFMEIDNLWKAEQWEPEVLMSRYVKAGAKYFVALANHHDNFDCHNSSHHAWNSARVGPRKDIGGTWRADRYPAKRKPNDYACVLKIRPA